MIFSFQMNSRSQLEIFPDELFLDLFSYISPSELYHVWHGLNPRFNAILRSIRASFDLFENTDNNHRALNHFSEQIVYIHLHTSVTSLNLRQFPNLRSLISSVPLTKEQLDSIRPSILPRLERLTFLTHLPESDSLNDIIHARRATENSLTWIKVYRLPRLPMYLMRNSSRFDHIQSMIIDRVTTLDIEVILSFFIFLRRLKVTVVQRTMIDQPKSPLQVFDRTYPHHHLVHLNITMNTPDKLDDFYPLLSRLSFLRSLYVACDSLSMADFQQLAVELHSRVPCLKRFNCSFQQTHFDDISKLHCLSPFFQQMRCQKIEWCGGWYYYCVTTQSR